MLDEFHHLRRSAQAALLRALDRQAFRPLGARRDLPVSCRVIVGLAESPEMLVARGRMLLELRQRLGFCEIVIPCLAERREEIDPLARQFARRSLSE